MKNIKGRFLSALLIASLSIPGISAYAEDSNSKLTNSLNKKQELLVKKQTLQTARDSLNNNKEIIKNNRETNKTLKNEIKVKTKTIHEKLKGDLSFDDETLEKIKNELKNIQNEIITLENTLQPIKAATEATKSNIKNKNFDVANMEMEKIISLQNTRTESLNKVDSMVDNLLDLINFPGNL
jgi:chromosome segregation ATPase